MDQRGGTSFAIFFVLNPILILFFQNCAVIPNKPAHANPNMPNSRSVSSAEEQSTTSRSCRPAAALSCAE